MARVNAYKIYCEVYDDEKKKKQSGMPVQWSHREFIHGLILDVMNYNKPTSKRFLEEAFLPLLQIPGQRTAQEQPICPEIHSQMMMMILMATKMISYASLVLLLH